MNPKLCNTRVAWVTGAGGGLGSALVRELRDQGWCVAATGHRQAPAFDDEHVRVAAVDVTDRSQVEAGCNGILEQFGRLDLLVNNAGTTADRLLSQMAEPDWDRVVAVNLKGAFLCSQAALLPMLRQREGHIINIGSFAARHGNAGQANYAAAKAGLIGLTQSLAGEAGPGNVCVNTVLPGVLPTPMTSTLPASRLAELADANALGRINSVQEVCRFVAFLATTRNISGQIFQLDSRISRWT